MLTETDTSFHSFLAGWAISDHCNRHAIHMIGMTHLDRQSGVDPISIYDHRRDKSIECVIRKGADRRHYPASCTHKEKYLEGDVLK